MTSFSYYYYGYSWGGDVMVDNVTPKSKLIKDLSKDMIIWINKVV